MEHQVGKVVFTDDPMFCEKCGLNQEIFTTHCPGGPVEDMLKLELISEKKLDHYRGKWFLI